MAAPIEAKSSLARWGMQRHLGVCNTHRKRASRAHAREGNQISSEPAQPADEIRAIEKESSARRWSHRVRKYLCESATF